MHPRWVVVVALVACANKKHDKPADDPGPAKPAPVATCDADPDFIHVDRDQLAALCIEAELPTTFWRPWHGALELADGERVPWLAIQLDERAGDPATTDWITRAKQALQDQRERHASPPAPQRTRTGAHWSNMPCGGAEAFTTVVTVVAFDKQGDARVFALRGDKMLDQALAKPQADAPFRAAFELTRKLVGGTAAIASHQLGGSSLPTVDYAAWQKATAAP